MRLYPRFTVIVALAALAACGFALATKPPSVAVAQDVYYESPEDVARDELLFDRETLFADVAQSALTTAQSAEVTLGPVEWGADYDLDDLATAASILDPYVEHRTSATVPLLLGDRTIAWVSSTLTSAGWEWSSVTCESAEHQRTYARAESRLASALAGAPDAQHYVDVWGSIWIVARRGTKEAAALADYYAYGCFAGPDAPHLPPECTVLSAQEFRTLASRIDAAGKAHSRRSPWGDWMRCSAGALVPAAFLGIGSWVVLRRRYRRGHHSPDETPAGLTEQALPAGGAPETLDSEVGRR